MTKEKLTVLVVDDNADLSENVVDILEEIDEFPIRCIALHSAEAARKYAEAHDVALALVDIHLPDYNGTQLLGELKRSAAHAQVIVMTGDARLETAIAAVDGGAFSYVVKPFESGQLKEKALLALRQTALLKERQQLRAELETSEAKHRNLVENVPAFVLALNAAGEIVLWNKYLEEVTGYSREEMLGKQGEPLIDGDDEQPLPLKPGGHRLVRWQRAIVASGPESRLTYAMGVDITEEQQMLQRTLRSERLAAVGTLAAGLAHEVRNPLNSALLQLQVLERRISKGKTSSPELSPVILLVKQEIHRLEHLVSDFLAFARPAHVQLIEQDVNEVVTSVGELLRPEAAEAQIELETQLSGEPCVAAIDPEKFRQIIINLVRNAVEACAATRANGHRIRLTTELHTGEISIEIQDDGPGFPSDTEIFDAFYTTKVGGTGLGLSIVHSLVTAHGGRISAQSCPGSTCFQIVLPTSPNPTEIRPTELKSQTRSPGPG